MAKSLREPPPSSSIARLLDPQAASRATATPTPVPTERSATCSSTTMPKPGPDFTTEAGGVVKREIILSQSTDETLSALIHTCRRLTGARLSASHLMRALLIGVAHSLPSLEREIGRLGPLKLPSNGREFERERQQFERKLAAALVAGMRAVAVMDADP